ncbi:MAG: PEP-CTERM sorting domain-containing protein [Armatimonadetes bacterium]|nr:PEP-CTERM sorting domain-containing protein [Armatimonadota bacterium]
MKNKFRLPHVLTAAIIVAIALSVPASALTLDTTLTGYLGAGNVDVHAVVTKTANIYDYNYTISYVTGATLHLFGIANDSGVSYFDAANNGGFINPEYNALDAYADIEWLGSAIEAGQSRTFSYQSEYAPMDITVYAYALNSAGYAEGDTLGMGAMIPEPSSILALALGLTGCAPFVIRRKK